jgi:hypothetical protein
MEESSFAMPKKARVHPEVETTLIFLFFNYCSIAPHEFISASQTVNQAYYLELLRHVKGAT